MITDGKKWHSLTVKNMATSLRWIKPKHDNDHYCINCLYLFRTEIKLKPHENLSKNLDYCYIEVLENNNNILKHSHGKNMWKFHLLFMLTLSLSLKQ